jgi:isopentenyl-diphosphate Delta-isomerase
MTHPPPTTDPQDEILAVVDASDTEIGGEKRGVIHATNLLHRAVHVFVFAPDGRLYLQQRSATKDSFPLHWECVGGHLSPGELYPVAAVREVEEELGLIPQQLERLTKLSAGPETGYEFIEAYAALATGTPRLHPTEVLATELLTRNQFAQEIKTSTRLFSPTMLLSVRQSQLLTVSLPWLPDHTTIAKICPGA